ncbi:MAG: histidine phosphatase family protein [Anaerolineales bacterium]
MHTTITLVRHGETDWNATRRWQGIAPVPLNENGIQQATETASHLTDAGITKIVASDLSRAYHTAQIIAERLHLPIDIDPRWREVDVGRWQGLAHDEILAWDAAAFAVFTQADYLERAFPDGERNRDHIARTQAALDDLITRYPGEHVLVATHGGSIRAAIFHLCGQYIDKAPNCSITQAHYAGGAWDVACIAQPAASLRA